MQFWTVRPLRVGTLHRHKASFLYMYHGAEPYDAPVIMYLLESGDRRVLVDTGCDDPAHAHSDHQPVSRPPEQHPLAVLAALNVDPLSIDTVINTHLHWDHCYGNPHFTRATFFVQREELRYAAAPLPCHCNAYDSALLGRRPPWTRTAFTVLDGDAQVANGVRIISVPGHTPGSQAVVVEGKNGRYLIPGDNVPLYENWTGKPPAWPHIPDTHHYDLMNYFASFAKMEAMQATVIPSHDALVFERAVYD